MWLGTVAGGAWQLRQKAVVPALQHVIGGLIRSGHVRAVLPERSGKNFPLYTAANEYFKGVRLQHTAPRTPRATLTPPATPCTHRRPSRASAPRRRSPSPSPRTSWLSWSCSGWPTSSATTRCYAPSASREGRAAQCCGQAPGSAWRSGSSDKAWRWALAVLGVLA